MKYREFGKTGLSVSAVSLGGLFFGKLDGGRDIHKTLAKAVETGINLIDTAAAYSGSEEALGKALKGGLREKFTIATKWWPYTGANQSLNTDPKALRAAVEGSLARLQTDRVELFMFHSVTHPGDIEILSQPGIQAELGKLKKEGKLRFVGLSNEGKWDPDDSRLVEAIKTGLFDFVMPELLLFRQGSIRNLFPLAAEKKTGVISIIPLGQAAWGFGLRDRKTLAASIGSYIKKGKLDPDKFPKPEEALDFLLDDKTTTIAAAALRFCLSFPQVSTVCCGTNDPAHIAENAAICDLGPYDAAKLEMAAELFGTLTHNSD